MIDFELPVKKEERFEQFYELVHMMVVDGDIDRAEMSLCRIFAKKFEYEHGAEMIDIIVQNIKNGLDWQESMARVAIYDPL